MEWDRQLTLNKTNRKLFILTPSNGEQRIYRADNVEHAIQQFVEDGGDEGQSFCLVDKVDEEVIE